MGSNENILIMTSGSIGDSIFRLPAIRKIKKKEPDKKIYVMVNEPLNVLMPSGKDIFNLIDDVDNVFEYKVGSSIWEKLFFLNQIKRKNYIKTLYYLMPERTSYQKIRDLLYIFISGIYSVRGINHSVYGDIAEWKRLLLTNKLDENISIEYFKLDIKNEIKIKNLNVQCSKEPSLVVSVGTKMLGQICSPSNWVEIFKKLHSTLGISVLFIGSEGDSKLTDYIIEHSKVNAVNLCGKTSILESYLILKEVGSYFGYDSGPLHLAVSAGCKVAALYSSFGPMRKWYPYGQEENIIRIKGGSVLTVSEQEEIWKKIMKILD